MDERSLDGATPKNSNNLKLKEKQPYTFRIKLLSEPKFILDILFIKVPKFYFTIKFYHLTFCLTHIKELIEQDLLPAPYPHP